MYLSVRDQISVGVALCAPWKKPSLSQDYDLQLVKLMQSSSLGRRSVSPTLSCGMLVKGDFIDDDDGMGYMEYGEEDDWGKAEEEGEGDPLEEPSRKKRKEDGPQGKGR